MSRAPRICSQPGCPHQATANARCAQHQPKRAHGWATKSTAVGPGHAAWRRAVLARDQHTCRMCGEPATEADHIINRAVAPDLTLDVDNGQALCTSCHKIKTRRESVAGRH
jgi:5-methylcytosine-specific restriction protein A